MYILFQSVFPIITIAEFWGLSEIKIFIYKDIEANNFFNEKCLRLIN